MSHHKQYLVGAGNPTLDDVLHVVNGLEIAIDTAAADRCKKDSPPPKNFVAEEATDIPTDAASAQTFLDENLVRAALFFKLVSLVNGKSKSRVAVMQSLASLINAKSAIPSLPLTDRDQSSLAVLAAALQGAGPAASSLSAAGIEAPQLSASERTAIQDGQSVSAGTGAIVVQTGKLLLSATTAVAALSAEALQADVKTFDASAIEAQPLKAAAGVADALRAMLEGSKQVNGKKAGVGAASSITLIPVTHGATLDAITTASTAVKAELATPAAVPHSSNTTKLQLVGSPALTSALIAVTSNLLRTARLSAERTALLLVRITTTTQSSGDNGVVEAFKDVFVGDAAAITEAQTKLAAVVQEEVAGVAPPPSLAAAWASYLAVKAVHRAVTTEAVLAAISLRLQEDAMATPPAAVADGNAANGGENNTNANAKKKEKKKGGAAGMLLGKGTTVLRYSLEAASVGVVSSTSQADGGNDDVDSTITLKLSLLGLDATTTGAAVDKAYKGLYELLNPSGHVLGLLMSGINSVVEANQANRKPKIAKGTRDFLPDQMAIREVAFRKITDVFKRHGAVSIDTPVFELRETLMGKYGEDSKLIYDLADQGGEILSLRYDLTVPFARYVAIHGITNIKRYHIAKVYRRDQPQMNRGRFREFFQCDFDIAGSYATMVADAEVLKVLVEILTDLELGEFEVKLNHRKLLDAMLAIAGVPAQKFRPICSAIDKLDKEPWEEVRREMVEDKGLPGHVADRIGQFVVLKNKPRELLKILTAESHPLAQHPDSAAALAELTILFDFLDVMGALGPITFDLSLARGLDYYTGVIYEAVLQGGVVGSIAAGGRYDTLVGMFSGKEVPAVGVSIGIERVFTIMESQLRAKAEAEQSTIRETQTEVLVASIGNGMQLKRMELASKLWAAGIKAEFGFKPNPKMGDQLNAALKGGIPLMVLFGEDELSRGVVKVKDMDKESEDFVEESVLVEDLKRRVREKGDRYIVARNQQTTKE